MADIVLPPNVRQDPNTGLYLITNAQGKTVRVNADTQEQLNQYVNSVNTGVPATVTTTDPNTGNPRTRTFDSTAIISQQESVANQQQLLKDGKYKAGVIGNRDGSYQDVRTGQTISKDEAEAKIKSAGLPPETLAAVTPKDAGAYAAAQQSITQTATAPSNIPPADALTPSQSEGGNSSSAEVTRSVAAPPATETLKPTYEPAAQTYPYDEQTTAPPPLAQDIGAPPDLPVEYDPYQIPTDAEVTAAREASVDAYLTSFPKDAKDPYRTTTQAVNDAIDADITAMKPDPRVAVGQGLSEEQVAQISKEVTLQKARDQTSLSQQRKQANDGDWRFKLSLAPNSNYLYKAAATEQLAAGQVSAAGIMLPLLYTDGVIFPYTPTISTAYRANYSTYDLTHSNYRGYFYQNSAVEEISLTGTFTAQDTSEANYLLAVIHFFRSVTKMFYGATDPMRGAPPPVCFLSGLGQYQFNYHPVLVSNFSYSLPNDVDYIRAGSVSNNGTNLTDRRDRGIAAPTTTTAVLGRLLGIKAPLGGMTKPPPPSTLQINSPTYVPTKMDISLTLLQVQSRSDISKVFNLQQYANGDQLKGGFW